MRMRVEMRPLRIQIPDRLYLSSVEPYQPKLTERQAGAQARAARREDRDAGD